MRRREGAEGVAQTGQLGRPEVLLPELDRGQPRGQALLDDGTSRARAVWARSVTSVSLSRPIGQASRGEEAVA